MKMRIVLSTMVASLLLAATAFAEPLPPPDDNGIGTSPSKCIGTCDPEGIGASALRAPELGVAPPSCGVWRDVSTEAADARALACMPVDAIFHVAGHLTCADALAFASLRPALSVVRRLSYQGVAIEAGCDASATSVILRRAPRAQPAAVMTASMEWAADPMPPAPPLATAPPNLETDPGGVIASLLAAAKAGQWRLLAGLILSILVWAARRWGAKLVPWLATDRGGAVLVLLLALLGGLGTSLAGDGPFGVSLLVNSLSMAFTAAGGYAVIKKILAPSDAAAAS